MFENLSDRLTGILRRVRGYGKLTERNIREAARDIRLALLEADVDYRIAGDFIKDVERKALGQGITSSITAGQKFVKIVYDELTALLGGGESGVELEPGVLQVVMLVGLQGSGKTTSAGKLAVRLRSKGRKPLLAAVDTRRPAAGAQLRTIAREIGVPCLVGEPGEDPVSLSAKSVDAAAEGGLDLVILDTGGRLHVDDELMDELVRIRERVKPAEILFVADAMTGQDAVRSATAFKSRLDFTGVILTKMDGDARGGAALSIRVATGTPVKFIGTGEKLGALEVFHPERIASRILGMGDIVSLVERVETAVSRSDAEKLQAKISRNEFTLDDLARQIRQLNKMAPISELVEMIPGLKSQLPAGVGLDNSSLIKTEAIINSMTAEERSNPAIINGSRRRRIARGSGTTVQDVNRLLKEFDKFRKLAKRFGKISRGRIPGVNLGLPF